jgi:hypothetical protein
VSGEKRNPVGIGSIVIGTHADNLGIPRLHFIVYKSGEAVYEAVNLEFALVSTGASGTEAIVKLAVLTAIYTASVLKEKNGRKELRKTAVENAAQGYWSEYRGVKFDLAQIGGGLNQDLNKRINKAVQEAFITKIKEALKDGAKDEVISLFTSACSVKVTYKEARVKERDNIIIGALKECLSRQSVEETFDLYGISDTQERIDKLNRCMGSPQTFFTPSDPSLEDKYECTVQMFLTRAWKLNELYERIDGVIIPSNAHAGA